MNGWMVIVNGNVGGIKRELNTQQSSKNNIWIIGDE